MAEGEELIRTPRLPLPAREPARDRYPRRTPQNGMRSRHAGGIRRMREALGGMRFRLRSTKEATPLALRPSPPSVGSLDTDPGFESCSGRRSTPSDETRNQEAGAGSCQPAFLAPPPRCLSSG